MQGRLVVGYGPMWAGKTTWLIEHYGDGEGVLAFKPAIDTRYTKNPVLKAHTQLEVPARMVAVETPREILEAVLGAEAIIERVLIDETNFFDDRLLAVVESLLISGRDVFAAGLLLDSDRNDFGATRKLIALADDVVEQFARCDFINGEGNCRLPACYTYARKKKESQLVVGAAELYGAVCRVHYEVLHVPSD